MKTHFDAARHFWNKIRDIEDRNEKSGKNCKKNVCREND